MPVQNGVITGDAIGGFRGVVILSAAKLYLSTGMMANRSYTPANMRAAISQYTGKQYPRSRKGLEKAVADLQALKDKADKTVAPLDVLGKVVAKA